MQKLEKAGEPTMEEILASIRQIISEEPATRQPPPPIESRMQSAGQSAAQPFVLPVVPPMPPQPAASIQMTPVPDVPLPRAPSTPPQQPWAPASASEQSARAGHQGGDTVAMSDSLAGPPKRLSSGMSSNIAVAQTAGQYGKSMWQFGKRPDAPSAASDAPPIVEPPSASAPANVTTRQPDTPSPTPTLSIEVPRELVSPPPIVLAPAPPPVRLQPSAASVQATGAAAPPMPLPVPVLLPAANAIAAAIVPGGPAPSIALPASPSRIAPPSDVLASFVPGRPPSIVGLAAEPKATGQQSPPPVASPVPIQASVTVTPQSLPLPVPASAIPPAGASRAAPFMPMLPQQPSAMSQPAPLTMPPLPSSGAPISSPSSGSTSVSPVRAPSLAPVAAQMPGRADAPSAQPLDVNAAMSALAAGLAGGFRASDTLPRETAPGTAAERAPSAQTHPAADTKVSMIAPVIVPSSQPFVPSAAISPAPPVIAAMMSPVKSLEDVVVDLLRPMLRQWLDENMPRIIEKSLRVELAESLKKAALPKP